MRICIFGAGAVGSHFAVRLALAGHDVCCVMRGAHLEAAKARGLTLRVGDTEVAAKVNASDDPADLGPQDVVISTLKATGLSSLVTGLRPLLRDDTAVVFAQNGIPWGTISASPLIIRRRPASAFSILAAGCAPPCPGIGSSAA
jgi:2-dehydropantoate 2-reductase